MKTYRAVVLVPQTVQFKTDDDLCGDKLTQSIHHSISGMKGVGRIKPILHSMELAEDVEAPRPPIHAA